MKVTLAADTAEIEFAKVVSSLSLDAPGQIRLLKLLEEDHPIYDGRAAAAVVRMRGWILISLARSELPDQALAFVLEELDTGRDPYLVAAAARALRSYKSQDPVFGPFVIRAIRNIRDHDEPVVLDTYGNYAVSSEYPTPLSELLATLRWLGPSAASVLPQLQELRRERPGLIKELAVDVQKTMQVIQTSVLENDNSSKKCCCESSKGFLDRLSRLRNSQGTGRNIKSVILEDQDGAKIRFDDFFSDRPVITAFFYTRCDNPQKCSLTITKLGRIQQLIADRGFEGLIRTAAITYDPGFDIPARLQQYGESRGFQMDRNHRLFRAVEGFNILRSYFQLGVNFVGSLVNRHRIEIYILDHRAQIVSTFHRIHYRDEDIVSRAIAVLQEQGQCAKRKKNIGHPPRLSGLTSSTFSTLACVAFAFFPKCPLCWATYLSFLGISWLQRVPYFPSLQILFALLILLNIWTVWTRSQITHQTLGLGLVVAGAITLVSTRVGYHSQLPAVAFLGVALNAIGSFVSAYPLSTKSYS